MPTEAEKNFSHLGPDNRPLMVDTSGKQNTSRRAVAESRVLLGTEIAKKLSEGDILTKKGPVFRTAEIAGIMGLKKTSELIPLCHPLPLDACEVQIKLNDKNEAVIRCTAKTEGKTGVEMEALTGASIAALTIYDMCKALSHDIRIVETRLIEKTGGKSDFNAPADSTF